MLSFLVVLCCFVTINGQELHPAPEPYAFAFSSPNDDGTSSSRQETGDASGRITGSYTILGADGQQRRVEYVADQDGFRANVVTNEIGTESQNAADVLYQSSAPTAAELSAQWTASGAGRLHGPGGAILRGGAGIVGPAFGGRGFVGPALAGPGPVGPAFGGRGFVGPALAGPVGPAFSGRGFVGPALAGPGPVGPAFAGRGFVGPALGGRGFVGPALAGPGPVGPALAGPVGPVFGARRFVGAGFAGPGPVGPALAGPALAGPALVGPALAGPGLASGGFVGVRNAGLISAPVAPIGGGFAGVRGLRFGGPVVAPIAPIAAPIAPIAAPIAAPIDGPIAALPAPVITAQRFGGPVLHGGIARAQAIGPLNGGLGVIGHGYGLGQLAQPWGVQNIHGFNGLAAGPVLPVQTKISDIYKKSK